MKVYNEQHSYYCGIDLHARTMYVCILDDTGKKVYHKNILCIPDRFLPPEMRAARDLLRRRNHPDTPVWTLCGVKFCFEKILKKPMPVFDLARQPRGMKLPVVLSREEVHQILSNIRVLCHR